MEGEIGPVCAPHAAQAEARHVRGTVRRERLFKKKLKSWLERKPRRMGSDFLLSYCKRNQQCSEAHQLHLSEWDHTLRLEGCLCCCNPAYGKRIKLSFSAATQALLSPKLTSFYCIHLFLHTSLQVLTGYTYCIASATGFGVYWAEGEFGSYFWSNTAPRCSEKGQFPTWILQVNLTEPGRLARVGQRPTSFVRTRRITVQRDIADTCVLSS